ncbi:MAG TPA: glycine betaine ABC transporter substrate-binding protein [Solirubrobacteraceae bacterium]|nr:glycine betaine ABC transporter substrate-binding protein [Solirubrobacteraceae bacterium]
MRALAPLLALLVALALSSCGGGGGAGSATRADTVPVRIGTKNFTESEILGELYKQALEAKGLRVDLQSAVGTTEVTNAALRDGLLDMYPEYIGVLLSEVDKIVKRPAGEQAAYRLAKGIEQRRGFTLLQETRLSNEDALAVTNAFARRSGVRSISDLARLRTVRLGAPPEFENRFEGMVGLRRVYGLRKVHMIAVNSNKGLEYPALENGGIDVGLVFTTDSRLAGGHFTLLRDPKGLFAVQHVAPLISRKALAQHGPILAATLNAVSALLTTPIMRVLNAEAVHTPVREVAAAFLHTHHLGA